tara:strand:+ start:65 stop:232 length:168 start_codon:yes stop_codon:yes gene_type:complete
MHIKLETKHNLEELKKQTLINILSAKGVIYTHYKNKQLTKDKKNVKQLRSLATNG